MPGHDIEKTKYRVVQYKKPRGENSPLRYDSCSSSFRDNVSQTLITVLSRKEVFFSCLTFACASVELRQKPLSVSSRKEVFQPHLPVRLPCYDLAPITSFALGRSLRSRTSGTPGFHGLTGGVYKARERIHRAMADARLLANPASWGRVADPSPN